jgi:hypothetical protein
MQEKLKKNIFLLLKIVAGGILIWILYKRIATDFGKTDINSYWLLIREEKNSYLLLLSIVLMPLNWIIESIKWKLAINSTLSPISLLTAFQSVWSGVAFGNLSPGRATEFAGKILFIRSEERVTATYLHFINGASQMLITLSCSFPVFLWLKLHPSDLSNSTIFNVSILIFPCITLLLGLLFFFPDFLFHHLKKVPFIKKQKQEHVRIPFPLSLKILCLSALRYFIFSIQFCLMLMVFAKCSASTGLVSGIILYYLYTTFVPMFSAVEALMRGGIAVMVFNGVLNDSVGIFIASSFLWLINIVIPSVTGYFFFLFLKYKSIEK